MINLMNLKEGYKAVIQYGPEIEMFRGEFIGLNGSADFYATNIQDLKREGEISLEVFLNMCKEDGVEPRKKFSGKFNVRISPELHQKLSEFAAGKGASIDQAVANALEQVIMGA